MSFSSLGLRLLRTSETSSAMEESPPTEQMEFMCGLGSLLFQMRLSRGKFFTGADLESWDARMGFEMEREFRWRAAIGRFADLNWFELLLDLIGSGTWENGLCYKSR